jgi:hypothetical protein
VRIVVGVRAIVCCLLSFEVCCYYYYRSSAMNALCELQILVIAVAVDGGVWVF